MIRDVPIYSMSIISELPIEHSLINTGSSTHRTTDIFNYLIKLKISSNGLKIYSNNCLQII